MSDHVIVWDIETVPDITGYAAANGLIGKSNEAIRESLGNKLPKHIYHSIVCIGALVAYKEPDHWAVDAIGAPHVGERTEKQRRAPRSRERSAIALLISPQTFARRIVLNCPILSKYHLLQ